MRKVIRYSLMAFVAVSCKQQEAQVSQASLTKDDCPKGADAILCKYTSSRAFADRDVKVATPDAECQRTPGDRFDTGIKMQNGKDKGKCIDKTIPRAITWLKPEEASAFGFASDNDHVVIAGVEDAAQSTMVARIPIHTATELYMHSESFGMGGFHSQLRMHFSQPVEMKPQAVKGPVTYTTQDLILNVTSVRAVGTTFMESLEKNFVGDFGIVWSVWTARARLADSYYKQGNTTIELKLDLKNKVAEKAESILLNFLDRGQKAGLQNPPYFHLFEANCYTQQLRNFAEALKDFPEYKGIVTPPSPLSATAQQASETKPFLIGSNDFSTWSKAGLQETYPYMLFMWNQLEKSQLVQTGSYDPKNPSYFHKVFADEMVKICAKPPITPDAKRKVDVCK